MHFSQIRVCDLILVNEDGEVVEGNEPINGAAFAIHSEIHKARPEVNAACHAHSVHGKAFSAFGRELDMITQDALRFYKDHAVYTEFGGVVLDREEGKRIAKALGTGKAAILQNHGLLTVGIRLDPFRITLTNPNTGWGNDRRSGILVHKSGQDLPCPASCRRRRAWKWPQEKDHQRGGS